MHEASRPNPAGAIEHELRAADVHIEELTHEARRMDDGGRVKHRRAPHAVEELVNHRGIAHVAGHCLDPR